MEKEILIEEIMKYLSITRISAEMLYEISPEAMENILEIEKLKRKGNVH